MHLNVSSHQGNLDHFIFQPFLYLYIQLFVFTLKGALWSFPNKTYVCIQYHTLKMLSAHPQGRTPL